MSDKPENNGDQHSESKLKARLGLFFTKNIFHGDPPPPFKTWYEWCDHINETGIVSDVFIRAAHVDDYKT